MGFIIIAIPLMMSIASLLISNSDYVEAQARFYSDLLKNQELTDVTLACNGYQIGVHRTVISASSLFFRDVIKNSKHRNIFIFLKGVSKETLDSLLQFIYAGEATVPSESLERLVEVGNELKVIGLMEEDVNTEFAKNIQGGQKLSKEKKLLATNQIKKSKDKIKDDKMGKQEVSYSSKFEGLTTERVKVEDDTEKLTNEINKRLLTRKDENDRVVHRCTVCDKEGRKKNKMRNHIETHLEGFTYRCKYCDVVKKSRGSLHYHEWQNHTILSREEEVNSTKQIGENKDKMEAEEDLEKLTNEI